jgi:hypothetical protein
MKKSLVIENENDINQLEIYSDDDEIWFWAYEGDDGVLVRLTEGEVEQIKEFFEEWGK